MPLKQKWNEQNGECPICTGPLGVTGYFVHTRPDGSVKGLLCRVCYEDTVAHERIHKYLEEQ